MFLAAQVRLDLFQKFVGLPKFIQACDHRVHDLEFPIDGKARKIARKLGFKNVRKAQGQPDAAQF